jgi:hypothetical protein
MNKDLDLDINNYDLQDILKLFKIPIDFSEIQLKMAKMTVLKTHPDKSGLSPEYFRFYTKAYKVLHGIWEFRKRGDINNDSKNTEYNTDVNKERKELLNQVFNDKSQFNDKKDFNKWFNKEFEKNKLFIENEEKGYESWLRSNEDVIDTPTNVTMATMGEEFEKKKAQMRSLVIHKDITDFWNTQTISSSELSSDAPDCFDSNMFSTLPYQDLQKAHKESVIPVTNIDYLQKEKFNTVNEYMQYRNTQDTTPLSEQQALNYLNNRSKNEEVQSIKVAYDLARQTETARKNENKFWASIQLINNK